MDAEAEEEEEIREKMHIFCTLKNFYLSMEKIIGS